ncbi:glutamine synthetase (plasmid) [Pontibacillus sp. ALD_SL1]|uniref:glutamine synthetase family protein n=1 Tax=Pontibacillus sp. ALD_SL1 TaxID=2777185 RepID=UPI001A97A75F|nr:glutamine synthetase [Pontibacillus sp. ALD_SL1]QST03118.1 glutamine synthetase [Pontibacillus sp. ALD_SL1]
MKQTELPYNWKFCFFYKYQHLTLTEPFEKGTHTPHDEGAYFDLQPTDKGEKCRRDIAHALQSLGYEVEALHHEVARGQHEIDFKFSDALKTADHIITFKYVVRAIARKHGLEASFMPKPIKGENGSGMHCHLSLFGSNRNLFYDQSKENGMSDLMRHFMAGILHHASALPAITNPTVNSYKRLVPGFEAPVNIAWSRSNRSCMIRVPAKSGDGTRFEVRNPDPSANPYLALSVLLTAGLDGLNRKLPLPKECTRNLFALSQNDIEDLGIESLPSNLAEAVSSSSRNRLIQHTLGDHAFTCYMEKKQDEWNTYNQYVTTFERNLSY